MVVGDRAMTAPIRPWAALSDGLTAALPGRARDLGGRGPNGSHDRRVARAAAEVAGQPGPDLIIRRTRGSGEQRRRGDEHARRAEAALDTPGLEERALERAQIAVRGQALDRRDGDARRSGARGTSTSSRAGRRSGPCRRRTRNRRSPPWCRSAPGRRAGRTAASGRARSRRDTRSRSPERRGVLHRMALTAPRGARCWQGSPARRRLPARRQRR